MNNEALVVGVSAILGTAVYFYVGLRLARRPVSPETRLPAMQFVLFWLGLAASTALTAILSVIAAFQLPPVGLVVAFEYYDIVVVAAALWGLICYLWFLYYGRSGIVPVTSLYILEFGLLVYYVSSSGPNGVSVSYGTVSPAYSTSSTIVVTILAVLILVIPEFVAAFAYLRLYFRTRDRTIRYRIALVGGGLVAFFFLDFVNFGSLSGGSLVWIFIGRLLVIVAALIILMAYYPPRYLRERYGVAGISDSSAPAPS